ncbi:MAG: hypothetical protein EXS10_00380 [Phycisphaerales bacterium]|nr:hypothetical protein [Phycisphaerales bacterium]
MTVQDPAPWMRVPISIGVSVLCVLLAMCIWYARVLLRAELSRVTRVLRLCSLGIGALAFVAIFLGLCVFDPDSARKAERVSFLIAWIAVGVGVLAASLLALIELAFVSRRGLHDYRAMRREVFGGEQKGARS